MAARPASLRRRSVQNRLAILVAIVWFAAARPAAAQQVVLDKEAYLMPPAPIADAVMAAWHRRWQADGVFCVLYDDRRAHCEAGDDRTGDAEYAYARGNNLVQ